MNKEDFTMLLAEETIRRILGDASAYECAYGRRGYYKDSMEAEDFEIILAEVRKEGFETVYDRTVAGNRYMLLAKEEISVHLSFLECLDGIRVQIGEGTANLTTCGDLSATGKTDLYLMHMDYTNQYSHDNGLGLISKLADGSFLIIDGGWGRDASNLIEYLEKNTPATTKPVVSLWLITHSHEDHYGNFREVMTNYADRLEIKNMIFGAPPVGVFSRGQYLDRFLLEGAPAIVKQHNIPWTYPTVGQVVTLPGVTLEVLYTGESYYPHHMGDDNNASTVTMLTFHQYNDTKVLASGDLSDNSLNYLAMLNGETLKCDILQVPHHGCSGGTKLFFDMSDPRVALFSTAEDKYYERIATNRAWNRYLLTKLHVEKSYYADGAYREILPKEAK